MAGCVLRVGSAVSGLLCISQVLFFLTAILDLGLLRALSAIVTL